MFPEIVIGPALIVSGVLILVDRHRLLRVMYKGLERIYGGATADMWALGSRASIGMIVAGLGWILLGVVAVTDALIS